MRYTLSRKILILCIVLFLLFLFGLAGYIDAATTLRPFKVWPDWEVWRLLVYPLAIGGIFDLLAASITFSAPGEELESMLGTRQFGFLLLSVVLGAALLHMVLFWGESVPLYGMMNPTVFALIGFVYLFPQSDIRVIFFNVRSWIILVVVVGLALAYPMQLVLRLGITPWILMTHGGFGIILGAAYFHARYQKYQFLLGPIRSIERVAARMWIPSPQRGTTSPQRASAQQPVRVRIPFPKSTPREMNDEERLNMLLDKINEKGYAALNDEERGFLDDYSNRI